jgi:hypothetical protein
VNIFGRVNMSGSKTGTGPGGGNSTNKVDPKKGNKKQGKEPKESKK